MTETASDEIVTASEIHRALDAYGAPEDETIHGRLRAWEQRERRLRGAVAMMLDFIDDWSAHVKDRNPGT